MSSGSLLRFGFLDSERDWEREADLECGFEVEEMWEWLIPVFLACFFDWVNDLIADLL